LLAIASLPENSEVNTRGIYPSCRTAYSSMGEPIFPNRRIDKIDLASLKWNPTIPTPRPREYIDLVHIRRESTE
jgi:hypothetical protein